MATREHLSLAEARRLALAAQGFAAPPAGVGARDAKRLIERLGVVQIDSVNALVRSHYLPLLSRLGPYPRAILETLAWGPRRQRALFEYWGHEASLLPLSVYPLLRWRMRRAEQGRGIYGGLARFGRERQDVIERVFRAVEAGGALGAGALATRPRKAGPWWDWSDEKQALEWLFAAGRLTVAGRRGFERLYDLPERVLPAEVLAGPEPDEAEAQRRLLLRAADALGVATETDLRDYFRLDPADSKARLAELRESGELRAMRVEGWSQPAYCRGTPRIPRRVEASALLSPFDSLVWARARTERLFAFRYRLEFYTPAHRRVYGYYVLPFLHRERIPARIDLRAERATGRLRVLGVHEEPAGLNEEAMAALALRVRQLADWLGLAEIAVTCERPESARLRRALADTALPSLSPGSAGDRG